MMTRGEKGKIERPVGIDIQQMAVWCKEEQSELTFSIRGIVGVKLDSVIEADTAWWFETKRSRLKGLCHTCNSYLFIFQRSTLTSNATPHNDSP